MRFGLVYWLEIVPSALVREIILYSSMLRILFLVWSSDLPLQNSKKIFIGLFCVLGNLERFLFFLYPQDQKRVDFAIFWLLASRKEENFYLQVEKVEKVDSGIPGLARQHRIFLTNHSKTAVLYIEIAALSPWCREVSPFWNWSIILGTRSFSVKRTQGTATNPRQI